MLPEAHHPTAREVDALERRTRPARLVISGGRLRCRQLEKRLSLAPALGGEPVLRHGPQHRVHAQQPKRATLRSKC